MDRWLYIYRVNVNIFILENRRFSLIINEYEYLDRNINITVSIGYQIVVLFSFFEFIGLMFKWTLRGRNMPIFTEQWTPAYQTYHHRGISDSYFFFRKRRILFRRRFHFNHTWNIDWREKCLLVWVCYWADRCL